MHVIRPVRAADLDQIVALADLTSFGLTTLPRDRSLLEKRVVESEQSFANIKTGEPRGQAYLLVIEDTRQKTIMGTSGIVSKLGGFEPFYAYHIKTSVQQSVMLNVRKEVPVLHLVTEHNGPSEIGSLFLHPDCRGGGNGRLLSLSRFLMMAEYPHLFAPEVIAEMRGVINDQGQSPFWDAVGKHFFDLEFPKADYLSIVNKEFIGDLMPVHPIYIALLPKNAQDVIGEVHQNTHPARKLLESEGFRFNQMIDIFEAGPVLHSPREMIRSVRDSRSMIVTEIADKLESDKQWLISSAGGSFRATRSTLEQRDSGVVIDRQTADVLQVSRDDMVRFVSPKA